MRPSIGLLVMFVTLAAAAAEAPPADAPTKAEAPATQKANSSAANVDKQDSTTTKPPQGSPATEASPDVFKPSENISEDAAIPYPVDI